MKKLILFAAGMLLSLGLMAQTDYKLEVGGVDVTSDNAANIFAGTENDGKASFDPATNTLSLKDINLPEGAIWFHPSPEADFNILVEGKCRINPAKNEPCVYSQFVSQTTITGVGDEAELTAYENKDIYEAPAIKCFGGDNKLTIENLLLDAYSESSYGIEASELLIKNAFVEAMGNPAKKNSAISCWPLHITCEGSELVYFLHNCLDALEDGSSIRFAPSEGLIDYGVRIEGRIICQYNSFDALQNGSGMVQWWEESQTLAFLDHTMETHISPAASEIGVEFLRPATIDLSKAAHVSFEGGMTAEAFALKTNSDLTIKGKGSATFFCTASTAIALAPEDDDITLTLDGVRFENVYSDESSIAKVGSGAGKVNVAVDGSSIYLGSNINKIASWTMKDCGFENAFYSFDDAEQTIWNTDWNSKADAPIIISPESLGLTVMGNPLTKLNCDDVSGDGSISYDPENNELTIGDGVLLEWIDAVILIDNKDLTIHFKSSEMIVSDSEEAIVMSGEGHKLTLISDGNVQISSNATDKAAISAPKNEIEFKGSGTFEVSQNSSTNNVHVIEADKVYVNTAMSIFNFNLGSSENALDAEVIVHEHIVLDDPMNEMKIEGNAIVWQDPLRTDAILEISLIVEPIDISLQVCGIEVNSLNADDILNDGGSVKFDRMNKLTLTNAKIEMPIYGTAILVSSPNPLIIELVGTNKIEVTEANGIFTPDKLTFVGPGKLTILENANYNYAEGIFVEGNMEVLDEASVEVCVTEAMGYAYAIMCGGSEGLLEVNNANLRASLDDPYGIAIQCTGLILGGSVGFITDDAEWSKVVTWDGSMFVNDENDLSHIWLGKDAEFPMAVANTAVSEKAVKVLYNGQLYILRDGKAYSITGQELMR